MKLAVSLAIARLDLLSSAVFGWHFVSPNEDRNRMSKHQSDLKHQSNLTILFRVFVLGISVLATLPAVGLTAACVQADDGPPGVVVVESSDYKNLFCETPSIVVLKNGDYLVSHTYGFSNGNEPLEQTTVYLSKNKGVDWKKISTIDSMHGASFALKGDDVFLIGSSKKKNGHPAITVSSDNGVNWSDPVIAKKLGLSGRLSPTAALIHNDRVWRSYSSLRAQTWKIHLYWAPYNSDWLDADNWSEIVEVEDRTDFRGSWSQISNGNPIPLPQGVGLVASCFTKGTQNGVAAFLPISNNGKSLEFDEVNSLFDFPGGGSKFTVRYDSKSKKYWAIVNKQKDPYADLNYQVLVSSSNLKDWKVNSVLFRHLNYFYFGKHNADWVFDGDDLVSVSQVAWEGAKSARHSTHIVFDRIKNFRKLQPDDKTRIYGATDEEYSYSSDKLSVTGKYVDMKTLEVGMSSVSHFKTKFVGIPPRVDGWKCLCTRAGHPSEISVVAKTDCEIFLITDLAGNGAIDVSGWTQEPELLKRQIKDVGLFSRQVKKGEKVVLPQGSWSGSQLLLPPGS